MIQDIIVCQVTSKIQPDNYIIKLSKKNTGLHLDSYIRSNTIFTIDKKDIKRKLGKISQEKYSEVIKKIINLLS